MSHLAGSHAGHGHQASGRNIMAIGFLAPQHGDSFSDHHPHPGHGKQETRVTSTALPQLEALAYGVNVQASMNRPFSSTPVTPPSRPTQTLRRHASQTSSRYASQATSPAASLSDQAKIDEADRTPRERRDPYSEEMQFFIMFARIVQEHDWRKIEDDFERIFKQRRPRDGLTAVYYRIRTRWGMQQVLKSGPDIYKVDIDIVNAQAQSLDPHFLRQIGYTL